MSTMEQLRKHDQRPANSIFTICIVVSYCTAIVTLAEVVIFELAESVAVTSNV
jgi:hypothetical protein